MAANSFSTQTEQGLGPDIVLTTLNARYHHSSFGLRYLYANLGALQSRALLREFVLKKKPAEVVAELLALKPRLIGFGVYIWNIVETTEIIRMLRERAPNLLIVVGGPEVSYETESQELLPIVDYIFCGESDFLFRDFCQTWLKEGVLPTQKILRAALPKIDEIKLPYDFYSAEDIRHRVIYVEASRGCPYKCEYCLSSLDEKVRDFPLDNFLAEMQKLIDRGARQFKFVDRTFNLSPSKSRKILEFFLQRQSIGLFLHFEMVPDRLPEELRDLIAQFPRGSLQFEIGIQTWNLAVAHRVSRRQSYEKIRENLQFLKEKTGVHTHVDLIVGLPGESVSSFAAGFNAVAELGADEIQVGILKRLKGTPIVRHDQEFQVVWGKKAPYAIVQNSDLSQNDLRELSFFADIWDMFANSGRFQNFSSHLRQRALQSQGLFSEFFSFSRFFFQRFQKHYGIPMEDQSRCAFDYLVQECGVSAEEALVMMREDYQRTGAQILPKFLGSLDVQRRDAAEKASTIPSPKRQQLHQAQYV